MSFRIDTGTGRIFIADDGAVFAPPSDSRFDASFSNTIPLGNGCHLHFENGGK